ncbi:anti-sigma factor family protein [Blastococcus xanthinilyticus]|uniref:Putative zinc finger protein n=1 Tax=Blastococcus xanthinilyticus TaxID=1564164 RepID=A0A5S5CST8_9ACTN|nr:anti-sigma factor [Blastococcus xanthinilyticus]TYP86820.1 putative zinc finger protein [Blastococcus xanthinilyticus]
MIPESHLAQEAIAALVDGELPAGPAGRAARHLAGCASCRMAVEAQREAKDALHGSADVCMPGDLMSRLCAIPFTAPVPGSGDGSGSISAGAGELTITGASGSWSVDLTEGAHRRGGSGSRWFRRGVAGTLAGLGAGVTALALTLPPGTDDRTTAGTARPQQHTEVVPPVVRTITVDTSPDAGSPGGTP